jgi:adenylate kinase
MRLVLFGPPGSGKGTQAGRICARYGLEHLSTGNILREEMERGTELGVRISGIVRSGALVDDSTVNSIVFGRLSGSEAFLLDGYPRNTGQAEALDEFLGDARGVQCALLLRVSEEEIVRRLSGRVSCPGCGFTGTAEGNGAGCPSCGGGLVRRPDDGPEVIRRRLSEYRGSTLPLEGYYAGRLCPVDGSGTVDQVWARLQEVLGRWS